MKVSIIVPTLNRLDLVQQMYKGLRESGAIYEELIIVDNGNDGTDAWARGEGVTVLKPDKPLTFAQSNNLAAKTATGDHLLLLNNDCVPLPGFLDAMTKAIGKAHIVGAKLLYKDNLVQHAGVAFTSDGYPQHLWRWASRGDMAVTRDAFVPAVTFACALVPKIVWDTLGGLDENFVNGFEDMDFVLRAKEMGAQTVYCAGAEVYHLESQTVGRRDHNVQNTSLWRSKWVDTSRVFQSLGVYPVTVGGQT